MDIQRLEEQQRQQQAATEISDKQRRDEDMRRKAEEIMKKRKEEERSMQQTPIMVNSPKMTQNSFSIPNTGGHKTQNNNEVTDDLFRSRTPDKQQKPATDLHTPRSMTPQPK